MHWLLPPVLWAALLLAMVAQWRWFPLYKPLGGAWHLIGFAPIAVGFAIMFFSAWQFRRVRTNIRTFDRPRVLVTDGTFARTRNPMYLGFTLSLFGFAILFNDIGGVLLTAVFFIVADRWYVPFEERAAQAAFGEEYDRYRQHVPRWL